MAITKLSTHIPKDLKRETILTLIERPQTRFPDLLLASGPFFLAFLVDLWDIACMKNGQIALNVVKMSREESLLTSDGPLMVPRFP
jgi:hypothetical protein